MNRLHKKCAIASAGLHLLLILILFVGPGFLAPKNQMPDMPLLDFVPFETVDDLVSGGGDPNARPPAAPPNVRPQYVSPAVQQLPAPPAKPEPEQKAEPEVQPEPDTKNSEAAMEPTPKQRKKPVVNLKQVVRKTGNSQSKAAKEAADRQAKQYADYRNKLASAIGSTANAIPGSISSSTTIGLVGPGGRGVPYANFLQAVKTVYTRAWELPEGVADDNATVETTVTIARDGSVLSAKIVRRSGNAAVDASVRATLDRVTYAAPLPKTATENQRTVTINFNVKAKRLLG